MTQVRISQKESSALRVADAIAREVKYGLLFGERKFVRHYREVSPVLSEISHIEEEDKVIFIYEDDMAITIHMTEEEGRPYVFKAEVSYRKENQNYPSGNQHVGEATATLSSEGLSRLRNRRPW